MVFVGSRHNKEGFVVVTVLECFIFCVLCGCSGDQESSKANVKFFPCLGHENTC